MLDYVFFWFLVSSCARNSLRLSSLLHFQSFTQNFDYLWRELTQLKRFGLVDAIVLDFRVWVRMRIQNWNQMHTASTCGWGRTLGCLSNLDQYWRKTKKNQWNSFFSWSQYAKNSARVYLLDVCWRFDGTIMLWWDDWFILDELEDNSWCFD